MILCTRIHLGKLKQERWGKYKVYCKRRIKKIKDLVAEGD